jgi:chloride channel protein, CIC family
MASLAASTDTTRTLPAPPRETKTRGVNLVTLCALAFGLGIATGLGAVIFRDLIGFIHNLMFLGLPRVRYDANIFMPPSPWGAAIILVPVIGAVVVTFLVSNFAPEARGHGVPEVMDAIYYNGGRIRPIVAVVKSLASAVAIGTGAAIGREGPIIQIGSAVGSTLGQLIPMTPGQRITLVAAGAGGGIAATFNTPIGGVLFAIELMMPEVSVSTFLPTAIATGTATFVGRLFFGNAPAFIVPAINPLPVDAATGLTLVLYALLGVIVGLAATAFIRGLHFLEDIFDKIGNIYLRHVLGMLLVGMLFYALFRQFGHYYVEGVGYATIQSIMFNHNGVAWFLFLLFLCKLTATCLSLGSGSSGGIFSPSLFMGATIGGAFAGLLLLLPVPLPAHIEVRSFALVGMGAMVGGGTGAVMTAVAMIFEMTRDYDIVLPMIIAVAFAVGVRRVLSRENIYTLKLFRRGHVVPKALHANMFLVRRARDVMDKDFALVPAETSFDAFLRADSGGGMRYVLVTSGDHIVGVQRVNTGLHRGLEEGADTGVTLGDVANRNFVIARENDIVFDTIRRMWRHGAFMAVVVGGGRIPHPRDVKGVISKEQVADSVAASIQIYPG